MERYGLAPQPLFPAVLGDSFALLPDAIRATHLTRDRSLWHGRAQVARGRGVWPRLITAVWRFPPAGDDVPVLVEKTVTARGETWLRDFDGWRFRSHLAASPQGMTERFGAITFLLALHVQAGALHYPVRAGRIGPLPLPRWLLPRSESREFVQDGRFHFDVALFAPLTGGLIIRYRGWLAGAADQPAACQSRTISSG